MCKNKFDFSVELISMMSTFGKISNTSSAKFWCELSGSKWGHSAINCCEVFTCSNHWIFATKRCKRYYIDIPIQIYWFVTSTASVNKPNKDGNYPIHLATKNSNVALVRMLVNADAKLKLAVSRIYQNFLKTILMILIWCITLYSELKE